MPIIKSAKKRVKQTLVRQARNYNTRTAVKKSIRRIEDAIKAGDKALAEKELVTAYKVIDTAAKKNVLNKNTASRRKSTLARAIADIKPAKKAEAAPKKKAAAKKPAAKKKAPAKKAPAKKKAAPKKTEAKAE